MSKSGRNQKAGAFPGLWGTNESTFNQLEQPNFHTHYGNLVTGGVSGGGGSSGPSPQDTKERVMANLMNMRDNLQEYIESGYATANENINKLYTSIEETLKEQAKIFEAQAQKIKAGLGNTVSKSALWR